MKMKALLALVVAVCMLAACTAAETAAMTAYNPEPESTPDLKQSEASPTPTLLATPAPTATPKPEAQVMEEIEMEIEQSIRDNAVFKVAGLLPEGEDGERLIIDLYNNTKSQWMLDIWDEVDSAIEAAVAQAEESCCSKWDLKFTNQLTTPSWQYLYTLLLYKWEELDAYGECINANLSIQVDLEKINGQMQATVTVEPVNYQEAIRTSISEDAEPFFLAMLVFDYTNTVFDEDINEKEYVLPEAKGNLASNISWPVQKYTKLRKNWYASRDKGARKHTGSDIWAPRGTEIYSCTAGTVFFIGPTIKGGNTVVILDDYGYMFEYCHMMNLPDFLREGQFVIAGQLIGYVGSTGNSSCNHLHLTIASPDGILIDPYSYLLDAKPD